MKYFFDRDDSGHWYMIPVSERSDWNDFIELLSNDDNRYNDYAFDQYRLGGGIQDIEFENPTKIS